MSEFSVILECGCRVRSGIGFNEIQSHYCEPLGKQRRSSRLLRTQSPPVTPAQQTWTVNNEVERTRAATLRAAELSRKRNYELRFKQREGVCHYCRRHVILTKDHVIPRNHSYRGKRERGLNHIDNYVFACHTCNGQRGDAPYLPFALHRGVDPSLAVMVAVRAIQVHYEYWKRDATKRVEFLHSAGIDTAKLNRRRAEAGMIPL